MILPAKLCLVLSAVCLSCLPRPAASEPVDTELGPPALEIKLSRVSNFAENVDAYLKAFTLMIPVQRTELDARDSNLIHVKGTILIRFPDPDSPHRLPDNLIRELSSALEKLAHQSYVLSGAYYSIPDLQILDSAVKPRYVDHSPAKRTFHLDAIDYRKHAQANRLTSRCMNSLASSYKQN